MTLSAADRLAILDVVTRADEAATRRDADAYVAPAIRATALITQELRRAGDTWLITRRTVAPAAAPR
jgi:hypothetical protein